LDALLNVENTPWVGRLHTLAGRVAAACQDEASFDARKVLARSVSSLLPQFRFCRTRTALLRALGLRVGKGAAILGPINVTGSGDVTELLHIGEGSYVSGPLHIDLGAHVHIGNGVRLGHDVLLLTFDHDIGPAEYRCGRLVAAPIWIGDGVWIGSRVTVLPGVTIGHGAVVAAGALVTRDILPNTLVAGVPARCVRQLEVTEAPPSMRRQRAAPVAGYRAKEALPRE
jgi:acetyltransferase-like isoleucine patch superfamily enzyme